MNESKPKSAAIRELFDRIVDLPEARRRVVLDASGADPEVRAAVESLLAANDKAGPFLADPTISPQRLGFFESFLPGAKIGPFTLVSTIGEGGYGMVYLAQQDPPLRRKVALKVIKAGMDTRQVMARFDLERQALARMDHPNIAKVFDAGATEGGRSYFVMELADGKPITDFCKEFEIDLSGRLELFLAVCSAVQHAHGRGIIHRDLKPGNVLVVVRDGNPVPKVIDFGIAKALTDEEGNDQRLAITQQPQFLGTPQYSSPEQAAARPGTVDHRSDVYSLGAMLYELLTDTPPFEASQLRPLSFAEILALLRDVDPPPPSVRLAARQMRKRGEQVRGDLDWIVMKAMDKNPSQRYDSAEALADDVRRFLAKEPVSAAPPGRIYRIRKLIQRRRMAVGISIAAAMVLFSLLGGIVVVILARQYGSRTAASPATLTVSPPTGSVFTAGVVSTQPAPLGMDVLQPGLTTELFASAEFKNPMGSRVDRQIDFDWPPGIPPDKGMPAPRYSVRWTGVLLVPPEGIEGIGYWVNGTGQVELDGLLVMRLDESSRKFVTLKIAGGRHRIVIEYRNRKGAGHATLYWRTKDGVEEKVPAEALFHVAAAP